MAPPPWLTEQQSSRCSGSAIEPGREHVLDGDVAPVAVHRQRVQGGAVPLRHRDLGQLLRGGAVLVEVPHGQRGVVGDPGGAVDVFIGPAELGHGRDRRVPAGAGVALAPARHGVADHDHLGQAVRDRVGRQVEPGRRRGRAHVAAGVEPDRVAEQLGDARRRASRRAARHRSAPPRSARRRRRGPGPRPRTRRGPTPTRRRAGFARSGRPAWFDRPRPRLPQRICPCPPSARQT